MPAAIPKSTVNRSQITRIKYTKLSASNETEKKKNEIKTFPKTKSTMKTYQTSKCTHQTCDTNILLYHRKQSNKLNCKAKTFIQSKINKNKKC